MSLATAEFDPRGFSPDSCYEPGLKIQNEPGLMGFGSCGRKSSRAQSISPSS
jgi:hypothetical protein